MKDTNVFLDRPRYRFQAKTIEPNSARAFFEPHQNNVYVLRSRGLEDDLLFPPARRAGPRTAFAQNPFARINQNLPTRAAAPDRAKALSLDPDSGTPKGASGKNDPLIQRVARCCAGFYKKGLPSLSPFRRIRANFHSLLFVGGCVYLPAGKQLGGFEARILKLWRAERHE